MKAKKPLVAGRQAGQRRDQDKASPGAQGRRGGRQQHAGPGDGPRALEVGQARTNPWEQKDPRETVQGPLGR